MFINVLIFDTETTGLPKKYNDPFNSSNYLNCSMIEFGYTRVVINTRLCTIAEIERGDLFVKRTIPEKSKVFIKNLTNIDNELLEKEGLDIKEVLEKFITLHSYSDYVVGHNVSFDMDLMIHELNTNGFEEDARRIFKIDNTICTMKTACKVLGYNKWPKLINLYKDLFFEEFTGAHNALQDVLATQECFCSMVERGCIQFEESYIKFTPLTSKDVKEGKDSSK